MTESASKGGYGRLAEVMLRVTFRQDPLPLANLNGALCEVSSALGLSPERDYELLISPTRMVFQRLQDLAAEPLPEDLEQGFLFGPGGQVEFREVSPGLFRIVAFREGSPLTIAGWQPEDVTVFREEGDPQPFILWGKRVAEDMPEWQEGRIPFPQAYPWTSSPVPSHLAVTARIYRVPLNHSPLYIHWQALTPAKEPDRGSAHGEKAREESGPEE